MKHISSSSTTWARSSVGIVLGGEIPWSGGEGTLSHQAQKLRDRALDVEEGFADLLLTLKDHSGLFMIGDFTVPLTSDRVTEVIDRRVSDVLPHPALDFGIEPGSLVVRVMFLEHFGPSWGAN